MGPEEFAGTGEILHDCAPTHQAPPNAEPATLADRQMNLDATAAQLLGQLLDRVQPTGDALASEADFKQRWLLGAGAAAAEVDESMRAPLLSLLGGGLATCLSQVFAAGYQGAIRQVYPAGTDDRWYAVAVSEDADDPVSHPPTQYLRSSQGLQVSGTKSWIAASAQVDCLLVRAVAASATATQADPVWFRCDSSAAQVVLSHRAQPGFLPDLSQGFASFAELIVPAEDILPDAPFANFMQAEAIHVGLALVGYMVAQWQLRDSIAEALASKQHDARNFAALAHATLTGGLSLAHSWPPAMGLLSAWQTTLRALVQGFEARWLDDASLPPGWSDRWRHDARLTGMYAPALRGHCGRLVRAALADEL